MVMLSSLIRVMKHRAPQPKEIEQSVEWRRERLERAGFGNRLAQQLASDRRIDLHAVLELIDRECPPDLAARIVAPLEDESER